MAGASSSDRVPIEAVRSLPVFDGLSDDLLATLVSRLRREEFAAGARALRQGEGADALYIILQGKFSLTMEIPGGQEQSLLTLTRGEVLGWSALVEPSTWLASATALKPSTVLAIGGPELRAMCDANHELGYFVMRNLFGALLARLHDTRLQMLDMYSHD